MKSDEQLMLEFQAGSTPAFEELFSRYRNPIHGFFRRRLNNAERSEDLAQETFVVIIRGSERYEPLAKFRTYIYAIAMKQLWTARRQEIRAGKFFAEPAEASRESDPAATISIREALSQLDSDHREVLMLREFEQLSYDEIAEVLVLPVNTVRSRLSRARGELRMLLEAHSAKGVSR